jgi:hypothetical protein
VGDLLPHEGSSGYLHLHLQLHAQQADQQEADFARMTHIVLEAHTLEEWREQVKEFNRIIREWKVPLSVASSGTPEVLEPHDKRTPGTAHLMCHGYARPSVSKIMSDKGSATHFISVRSTCFIPAEDKWLCYDIRDKLLDEGYATDTQPDVRYTHMFHCGKRAEKGIGWLSFGIRATDEEAIAMLLRDFDGIHLLRLEGGVYLGMDVHP